jgi:hypothetical protein
LTACGCKVADAATGVFASGRVEDNFFRSFLRRCRKNERKCGSFAPTEEPACLRFWAQAPKNASKKRPLPRCRRRKEFQGIALSRAGFRFVFKPGLKKERNDAIK